MKTFNFTGKFQTSNTALLDAKERQQAILDSKNAGTKDPNYAASCKKIAEAKENTTDLLEIDSIDEMALDLYGNYNDVQEVTLNHRKTLAITISVPGKEYYFNTNKNDAGEHVCNMMESGKMGVEEVIYITHLAFDIVTAEFDTDEILRLYKNGFLCIRVGSMESDIFRKPICLIPGIYALKPIPEGVNQGAASADVLWVRRGVGFLKLLRPIKVPANTNLIVYVDVVGTTAKAISGATETFLKGWHGKMR